MEESVYRMPDTGEFYVTREIQNDFDKNGYILVRGLFSPAESVKIRECVENSEDIRSHAYGRADSLGRTSRMCVWNHPGNDLLGVVARSQKVSGTIQALLGGDEIYHYHSKLMMKEARTGGSFLWHQDYGYWFGNGCMLPEMGSVFMPIDRCVRENGCLQVLKGSHKLGRIEHQLAGEQAGADHVRLEEAKKIFDLVHVEMEPGDALFFHCNLLHTSDQNNSDLRRYVIITSVNKRKNNPTKEHHHPRYTPLRMLPNSEIMKCQSFNSTEEKWFMDPDIDKSYDVKKN